MIIDLASQISLKNYPRLEKSKTNLNMRNIFWMLTMRQSKIQEPGNCMPRERSCFQVLRLKCLLWCYLGRRDGALSTLRSFLKEALTHNYYLQQTPHSNTVSLGNRFQHRNLGWKLVSSLEQWSKEQIQLFHSLCAHQYE